MSTEISRVRGRYLGLKAYLNSVLNDLSGYISSGSCEQNKLLGFKNNVDTIVGQTRHCS